MNELLSHEQYVCANLADRVAARTLIDHREELLEESHAVAVYAVAAIRTAERAACRMAEATALLAPGHSSSRPLCAFIRSYTPEVYAENAYILIVRGGRGPTCHGPAVNTNPPAARSLCITVGAIWVLRSAAAMHRAWGETFGQRDNVEGILNAM